MQTTDDVNLCDRETYANGIPHELFAHLRATCPIGWRSGDQEGFWAVVRHEDVVTASRDHTTFSSAERGNVLPLRREYLELVRSMMILDAPDHKAIRMLVQKAFTPKAMAEREELVRRVTREVLAKAFEASELDFSEQVAGVIPAEVIGIMLGVPEQDRARIAYWAHLNNSAEDPANTEAMIAEQPWQRMQEYGAMRREQIRREGGDGTLSDLLHGDGSISDRDYELNWAFLALAGNQTTRDAMTVALLSLLEHPAEAERLVAHPEITATATEEVLRWAAPVHYFSRTATCDTELGGQSIKQDERVALFVSSANFDEAVFEEPLRFDLGRQENPHVTFGGGGPHVCLGAHLARLEVRILLEELGPWLGRIEQAGPARRLRSHQVNGWHNLPIRITG